MKINSGLQERQRKHLSPSSTSQTTADSSNDALHGQGLQDVTDAAIPRNPDVSTGGQTSQNETDERPMAFTVDFTSFSLDKTPIRELWNVAYERLRQEDSELIAKYEATLGGDIAAGVARTLSPKPNIRGQMWTILQRRMKDVNDNTMKLQLDDHEVEMEGVSQPILNVMNSTNDYISQSVSANQFTSIAWTGISFLLPLFMNASIQGTSLAKELEYVASLITQSEKREELYFESFESRITGGREKFEDSHREYKATLEELYRQILKFQAISCCHYSNEFRLGLDTVKWNGWDHLVGEIREKEKNFAAVEQIWRDIRHVEEQLANENATTEIECRELLDWLSDSDPSSTYNVARDRYEKGTNEWLFKDSEEFKAWETMAGSLIWLHGKAGSGKSVLTSSVINYLQNQYASKPSTALAYYYFSFNDIQKQQVDEMLASLVKQICLQRPSVPQLVKRLDDDKAKDQRPDTQTLEAALISSILGYSAVFIIIDGLDECPLLGGHRDRLLQSLRRILQVTPDNLHTLLTSRKESDINLEIRALLTAPAKIDIDLQDHQQNINSDIGQYINSTLATGDFQFWSKEVKEEARQILIEKADCMFQYIRFQLEALKPLASKEEICKALQDLPTGLDATYDRILKSFDPKLQSHVINLLKWLAFTKVRLTINELSEISMIRPENDIVFNKAERSFTPREILKYFSGLIVTYTYSWREIENGFTYEKSMVEVRLAHFSIKEYLTSHRLAANSTSAFSFSEIDAHLYIATSCLAYLRWFSLGFIRHRILGAHLEEIPRTSWPTNIIESAVLALAVRSQSLHLHLDQQSNSWNDHKLNASFKPHCYTAWRGFYQMTELLISQELGTNRYLTQEDLDFGLHYAACGGRLDIVRLFLEAGANINTRCGKWGSALDAAVEGQSFDVLEFLASYGADANGSQCSLSYQPCSDTRIMKVLLDGGANIDMESTRLGTALCLATAQSDPELFDLLLERRADVNVSSGEYDTPLRATIQLGYRNPELMLERIQKLLDRGADPNIQAGENGTALEAACDLFQRSSQADAATKAMRLLIERGANVTALTLREAASSSHSDAAWLVQFLLDNGAEIDQTTLPAACGNGTIETLRLLVDYGADVNEDGQFGAALQAACYYRRVETVRFLLDCGADVNAKGGRFSTALQATVSRQLDEDSRDEDVHTTLSILELLINEGVDMKQQGGAALRTAAEESPREEVLRLLLAHGVDVNAQDEGSTTALIAACMSLEDDTKCVRLLLDHGADVNAQGKHGTALVATCQTKYHRRGYERLYDSRAAVCVAQWLLDRGADVNAQHGEALIAACYWSTTLMQLLLEHGADVQLQDCAVWHAAADFGSNYKLQLLLEHGIDVNHVSQEEGTALHAKMNTWDLFGFPIYDRYRHGPTEFSFLLEHGLDPNITTEKLGSALQIACGEEDPKDERILESGALEIHRNAEALLKQCPNIDVNAQGGFFGSALQAAAYSGQTLLVKLLLDKGANVDARGGKYTSALNGAVVRGCWDIVEILLKSGAIPDCHLQQQPDEEWLQSILERDGSGAVERYRKFWEVEMREREMDG